MTTDAPFSVDELRACLIAREFEDGERVFLGAGVNAGRAAVLLAHRLHGPNMRVLLSLSWTNLLDLREIGLHPDSTDYRDARWAEAYVHLDTWIYDYYRFFSTTFVVSGIQVDRFGNTNLVGLGDDHSKPTLRGPGAIGSVSSTAYAERFYIIPPKHTRQILVERCDFVSAVGWHEGGADARERLGLPGGGPKLCITELCVFDFDDETKAMRLKSIHPGRTVDEVVENTGFDVLIPDSVPETEPPRPDELDLLRSVIDPDGILRR
jgi:glutaconate CoA-transferase subunit B